MKTNLLVLAGAAFLLAACAGPKPGSHDAAAEPTSQTESRAADGATDDKQRIRCVSERVTGSNLPIRTCRTVAEWERIRGTSSDSTGGGASPAAVPEE